jgi:hypothetical protein
VGPEVTASLGQGALWQALLSLLCLVGDGAGSGEQQQRLQLPEDSEDTNFPLGILETTPDNLSDRPEGSHNPKVAGLILPPPPRPLVRRAHPAGVQAPEQRFLAPGPVEYASFSGPGQRCVGHAMAGWRGACGR